MPNVGATLLLWRTDFASGLALGSWLAAAVGMLAVPQQMLAIGRALMSRPSLLLLDEPTLGLAPLVVREIFQTLRRLNHEGVQ